jgi:hypothetical protein
LQGGVVAQQLPLGGEVADAGVDAAALLGGEPGIGGLLAECGDDGVGLAGQELEGVGGDPGFGGRVGVVVEAPGGLPEIFEDMNKVDQDVDRHAAAGGFGADELQLVAGAVDQHDPGAPVGGVTLLCLVEHLADHVLAGSGDRADKPFCGGDRPLAGLPSGTVTITTFGVEGDDRADDIVGPAGCRVGVVDDPQGRHPLTALLFAAGQPGPVAVDTLLGCGFSGLGPQRLGTHHHALAVHAEHQHGVVGGWLGHHGLGERVDVGRGGHGQLLDPPLAHHLPAAATDRLGGLPRTSHAPPPGRPAAAAHGCDAPWAAQAPHRPGRR